MENQLITLLRITTPKLGEFVKNKTYEKMSFTRYKRQQRKK